MKTNRSFNALAGAASVALLTLAASSAAHADNVYWSVGLSSPGVQVALTSPQPVYVQHPVYVQQQPVYVQPQVVYQQPHPVHVQPRAVYHVQAAPVYVAPRVVYTGWHHARHGWRHEGRHEMRNEGRVEGRAGARPPAQSHPRAQQHLPDPGNGFMMR